jgi:RNA polymerase sigma factor (sigma-70 family)
MARNAFSKLFSRLRPPDAYPGNAVADAELLRRYAEARDPAAFELLVWRHGPLVLGTCRRVTRHEADAEDAFQATFLVLAGKAGGVRQSLPGWLHRTARRAALRTASRRRVGTLTADVPATTRPGLDADELALLDAAVDGLGERHRRVVVLCYLQGHTAEDAAAILGVPRGTVLSRLATARGRLAATLTRRGVTLPAALGAATMSFDRVTACVELTLNPRVAAPAAAIAQGVLTMMFRHQIAVTAAALTLVGVGVTGTGVALMPQAGGNGPPVPAPVAAKKDDPAVKMVAVTVQIATTERKLTEAVEQWKQIVPKVPAGELRAKAELLGAIDLLIFKSEVEIRKYEVQLEPIQKELDNINKLTLTEEMLVTYAAGGRDLRESNELREIADSLRRTKQLMTGRKGVGTVNVSPEVAKKAEADFEKYKKLYLEGAAKEIDSLNRSYREWLAKSKVPDIKSLTESLNKEKLTLSVTAEKRKIIAIELTQLEAVPAEPAAAVALRQELATLTAGREALKTQHPEVFDPATRSAVAMEKVLLELIELRAEVKRLRDGK